MYKVITNNYTRITKVQAERYYNSGMQIILLDREQCEEIETLKPEPVTSLSGKSFSQITKEHREHELEPWYFISRQAYYYNNKGDR